MLHTSYGAPLYGIPCRISGAAYAALPQNVELRSSSVMMRAKPKSDTFTLFSLSSKMFSHFKSLHGHRNRSVDGGSLLGGSNFRSIPQPNPTQPTPVNVVLCGLQKCSGGPFSACIK